MAPWSAPTERASKVLLSRVPLVGNEKLNRELRQWEQIYNTVRTHQSLGDPTRQQFLLRASSLYQGNN